MKHNRFKIYDKPNQLNIVGVRNDSIRPNHFDDKIHVFFRSKQGRWQHHIFNATTDPGTFWLKSPMSPQGTAILANGQYVDAYHIGMHKGQYKALVQQKPVTVIRDYDRDAVLDFNNGRKENGRYGINIHRAARQGTTLYIDKYSAGCQVFANAQDFQVFLNLCQTHADLFGNTFTYTLIDLRALQREALRKITIGSLLAAAGLGGWLLWEHLSN